MLNSSQTGFEYVKCNLCGSDDPKLLFKLPVRPQHRGQFNRDLWDIVRCNNCGLIYENPRPDSAARSIFYSFGNSEDRRFVDEWFLDNADINSIYWRQILKTMNHFISPGHLLDTGCGAGTFMIEAKKAGYTVSGQEISPFFAGYCREKLGLEIFEGELETLGLPSNSFDVLTAFDVIEHHPNPRQFLNEIHRLVHPDGLVVISTHDIGNFFARLYGVNWRYLGAIGHLTYFTRETLTQLLKVCGYRIVYIGGGHTIDANPAWEWLNRFTRFWRLIILRGLILWIYRPITAKVPRLTNWRIQIGAYSLTHQKLLMRAGKQIAMDDEMVALAIPNKI